MKGLFIPDITAEMFKNGCFEGIEALMAEGEMYDIDYTEWIPVSKGSPKDLEEVNVTYVNHNPPVYYEHERGKPHTAVAVLYQGMWYWWDSTITDTLAEYGDRACAEPIDRDISITAWKPLPKPYKESDSE